MALKFFAQILNPPYCSGLHMDFLNNSLQNMETDGYVVQLHPAGNFINQGCDAKKNYFDVLSKHISEIELVNPYCYWNRKEMRSELPLSITTLRSECDKLNFVIDCKSGSFSEIEMLSVHSFERGYYEFKDKAIEVASKNSLFDNGQLIRNGKTNFDPEFWYLEIPRIHGPLNENFAETVRELYSVHFYTLFDDKKTITRGSQLLKRDGSMHEKRFLIGSKDKTLIENSFSYLKSKTARAALSIYKFNTSNDKPRLKSIPWFDMERRWTDALLFKEMKLSDEAIDYIRSFPDYYNGYSEN